MAVPLDYDSSLGIVCCPCNFGVKTMRHKPATKLYKTVYCPSKKCGQKVRVYRRPPRGTDIECGRCYRKVQRRDPYWEPPVSRDYAPSWNGGY